MSDRLSRWLIDRLPSRRLAPALTHVSADGLHFRQGAADRVVAWQAIERVVASLGTQLVGDTQILVLGLRSGDPVVVAETDPGWHALIAALHRYLPGASRPATWQLELIGSGQATLVFQR